MEHVPSVAPIALAQRPPQHSLSAAHASPNWVQNDGCPSQAPLVQSFEQQSPFIVHELPAVRHDGFSGAHLPALQFALQHWPDVEHDSPWDVHGVPPHVPLSQMTVQQSCGLAHALPEGRHPLPEPPVPEPPVLDPPVPVLVPPVLAPPVLAPPEPEAPTFAPPAPGVSPVDELSPHVASTMLENKSAAPAKRIRWIMCPPNLSPAVILLDAPMFSPVGLVARADRCLARWPKGPTTVA
jgi:hypothetical protein